VAIAIVHNPELGEGDVLYDDANMLVEGRDLETAVYLSLFLDAPAREGDEVPAGATRRGFWADVYSEDGDAAGSRLWLLDRGKATTENALRAEEYAKEALAWMVRDGVASSVSVSATVVKLDGAMAAIVIQGEVVAPDGASHSFGPWEILRAVQ
jgi:phage gp46-like protein